MMAQIYTTAEEVLVWLGESQEWTTAALWALHTLGSLQPLSAVEDSPLDTISGIGRPNGLHTTCPCCGECTLTGLIGEARVYPALSALLALYSCSWFSRLWVLQEVALAKSVIVCHGKHMTTLETLFHGTTALFDSVRDQRPKMDLGYITSKRQGYVTARREKPPVSKLQLGSLLRAQATLKIIWDKRRSASSGEKPQPLLSVMLATTELNASELRDRLYAVRALAAIGDAQELKPNYALPVRDVWKAVTLHVLRDRSLGVGKAGKYDDFSPHRSIVLAFVVYGRPSAPWPHLSPADNAAMSEWPSWVPDCTNLTLAAKRKSRFYSRTVRSQFRAGGRAAFEVHRVLSDSASIEVPGIILSKINAICEVSRYPFDPDQDKSARWSFPQMLTDPDVIQWYAACHSVATKHRPSCLYDGSLPLLFRRGVPLFSMPGPDYEDFQWAFLQLMEHDTDRVFWKLQSTLDHYKAFETLCECALSIQLDSTRAVGNQHLDFMDVYSRLAWADDRRLGWVPETARVGDFVCLLQGAPCPFVVRKREDGCYDILGDAYIERAMKGAAWPESEADIRMIKLR